MGHRLLTRVAIAFTLVLSVVAQDPSFRIRVNVPVVSLEAVVLNSNGRPVTTLKRQDFSIFEDGAPREIQSFSSVESPYSILLLFQNTVNVLNQRPFMLDASNKFLETLRPQDRVSVYTTMDFGVRQNLNWRNAQTGKRQEVKVGPPAPAIYFNLYEAIDDALGKFGGIAGRKGMVVLTNGRDYKLYEDTLRAGRVPETTDKSPFQKTLKKVRERGIPLYIVATNTDKNLVPSPPSLYRHVALGLDEYEGLRTLPGLRNSGGLVKRKDPSPTVADDFLIEVRSRLEQFAEASGGRIYFPKDLDEVTPLYEQIGRELGTSYSIGYAPAAGAGVGIHSIEVRVADPELRVVQSRQSYTVR
jgi:Ca-activated chloride channel homolog